MMDEPKRPTDAETARELAKFLSGPHALPIIKAKGMEPAAP